jgi:hypothetical protein
MGMYLLQKFSDPTSNQFLIGLKAQSRTAQIVDRRFNYFVIERTVLS